MAVVTKERMSASVREFLAKPKQMLIDGKWVDAASSKKFDVYDPSTGEVLTQVAEGDAQDIDKAVEAARRAFDQGAWRDMKPAERARILWRVGELIDENNAMLAEIESIDNGKPFAVAQVADVPLAGEHFRYYSGWPSKHMGSTFEISAPGDYHVYTLRQPVGVVGQIIPWNFPLLMAVWKLAPALATGCTVVLKTAEQTPLSAIRLGEILQEAGVPDGVVNIVSGYGETAGAALAAHEKVDKVAFTGSTEVGKLIVQAAAGNLKKVSLELGGKSPNVVFGDADVEAAAMGAAHAIFFNHGQCCVAGSRLLVHEKVYDDVVAGVADIASNIKLGPGLAEDTEMGPLVSKEQLDKVTGLTASGMQQGAQAACGGSAGDGGGYFYKPTVLTNVNRDMDVIQQEIFGPVVCAQPFSSFEDLISIANDTHYGLAAGVWTKDLTIAHKYARAVNAGTVWINCYNVFDAALPFGGYKQSGWGREMGAENLELYTETKAVCMAL